MFQEFFFDIFLPSPVFQRPFDIILAISFSFLFSLHWKKYYRYQYSNILINYNLARSDGKYCNNLKILSTEDINIIIIITVQRYYPCTIATVKSISRNRANLIASPSCMANVRFNIGRYPGENKSAGNSIRYLGTTIHRKRLIFALVIHQRNIADHACRPSTFSSPVRNGINFACDLQRTCIAIDSPNLRYTLSVIYIHQNIYVKRCECEQAELRSCTREKV